MNERRHLALLLAAALSVAACASAAPTPIPNPEPATPTSSPTREPTPALTPTPKIVPTSTIAYPPSDLPFTIDCSALPAGRQKDCDAYLAATRDRVYPILREMTGVNLSQCYKSIRYVILPTDPAPGVGGFSSGDTITYSQEYTIDLKYPYDVHEILHSASHCAGALDLHLFHGFFLNAVYDRLGVHEAGWFHDKFTDDFRLSLERSIAQAGTASGDVLVNLCRGILSDKLSLAYLDLGANAFRPLYRSTIPPQKILTPPGTGMTAVWGAYAPATEALVETLRNDFKYTIDVPSCGLQTA